MSAVRMDWANRLQGERICMGNLQHGATWLAVHLLAEPHKGLGRMLGTAITIGGGAQNLGWQQLEKDRLNDSPGILPATH